MEAEIQAKKDEMDNDDKKFFDKDEYDAAYALIYATYGKEYVPLKKRKDRDATTRSNISKVPFDLERIHRLLGPQSIITIPIDNSIFGDISTYNSQLTLIQNFKRDNTDSNFEFKDMSGGENHEKMVILQNYINQINGDKPI